MITIRQYAPMEVIYKENDQGATAFVIQKGKVEATRIRNGKSEHVGFLETGAAFGEMGVVDGSPRSTTVTAIEETVVREIHRDNIHGAMKESPDAVVSFLKSIFERLREANVRIARLESGAQGALAQGAAVLGKVAQGEGQSASNGAVSRTAAVSASKPAVYSIEGLTPQAMEAIPDHPFKFTNFPLRIGRRTNDPLVNNHLEIEDQDPLQISRHHVNIVMVNGKLGVVDQGSKLGALVDDVHIGGKKHPPGPAFFKGDEGVLILGTATSPYRYRIRRCAA